MIDFNEFLQKYKQHLDWLRVDLPAVPEFEKIFKIFSFVMKNGGWVRTIGLDRWRHFSEIPEPRKFFEKNHLVSFERLLADNWPFSAEATKTIDYSLLQTIPITSHVRPDEWEEFLAEDIVVYRDIYRFGIREDLISLESIKHKHGETDISVIVQESDTSEFSVKKVIKQTMKLRDYIDLMESSASQSKFIRFAVNIDFGDWKEEVDEIRKHLPAKVLWCSEDDSLKHLRQHVLGMTLPQLYLKINGCWTGGHEENLRFPSANINHGPSSCEWWGLDSTQSQQLRECILQEKNFEIYNSETLWWPDEMFCLAKGFRIFHAIQLPGDLVVVGPGTIHWVKSLGVTTNSAWNFGPKYLSNFIKSYERNNINLEIKYRSLVPMNILALDLINSELETLDVSLIEYLKSKILIKAKEELETFNDSEVNEVQVNNSDNVIHCENCYQELFRIYYKCLKCEKFRFIGEKKKCFFCFTCMKATHNKKCRGKIAAVQKFKENDLQKLFQQIDLRCEGKTCAGNLNCLKYPYDKNAEEGVYVSLYNGIRFDAPEEGVKLASISVLTKPGANKTQKVTDLLKKKKKNKSQDLKNGEVLKNTKLRSFAAKKKMGENKKCRNVCDLNRFIREIIKEDDKKLQEQSKIQSFQRDEKGIQASHQEIENKEQVLESASLEIEKKEEDTEKIPEKTKENSKKLDKEEKDSLMGGAVKQKMKIEEVVFKVEAKNWVDKNVNTLQNNLSWNFMVGDKDLAKNIPLKRKRSSLVYSPVTEFIPSKTS